MTSAFTPNKKIEKPANGDYPDTWDVPVNSDWDVVDKALGSSISKTFSNADITLTISEAQNQQIIATGTLSANVNIIIPFQNGSSTTAVGGNWIVYNNTTGAFTVSIVTQVGGSTGVTIPQGYRAEVYSDTSNMHFSNDTRVAFNTTGLTITSATFNTPPSVGLTIPVTVANGGTGATTHAAGSVLLGNSASAFSEVAPGASGNVLTSNGSTWTSAAPTGGGGGGGLTSLTLSGGTTGLLINGATSATLTSNGTWTLSGTLGVAFGGTGATSLTGYVKGTGTSALSASSTIPGSDISGNISGNAASITGTITGSQVSGNISGNATNITGNLPAAQVSGTVANATTATNLSGGSASGTSASWSGNDTAAQFVATGSSPQFNVGSSTGTYGLAGFTVGWEISGTTIFSCGPSVLTAGSSVASANCYFGTAWTNISDERTKKNIADYPIGLSAINQLRPISFQYNGVNNTPDDGRIRVSFIAQEVANTALFSMVSSDENGYMNVNTNDLIFALVNAVKELSARVVALEAKVP